MSVLPRSIINRIVAEHFCEDITTAKDVLYSNFSVPPKQRRIKRQGVDNKTKNNIDDIYKVLDETDPDVPSSLRAIMENFHVLTLITLNSRDRNGDRKARTTTAVQNDDLQQLLQIGMQDSDYVQEI